MIEIIKEKPISDEKPDTKQTGSHCEERSDAAIPDISEQNARDRHEPLRGSRDDTIFERTFENWNRSWQIRIE